MLTEISFDFSKISISQNVINYMEENLISEHEKEMFKRHAKIPKVSNIRFWKI